MNRARRTMLPLVAACAIVSGCGSSNSAASSGAASSAAVPAASAPAKDAALQTALQQDIDAYLKTRGQAEHISAVSFSLSRAADPENLNLTAGTYEYGGGGGKVTPASLFQIGSITKSFTSVAILHLAAAGKLSLDDTVGKWLPQYPAWKDVTIRRLLDMTSGIETYDNNQRFQRAFAKDPMHFFSAAQLVSFVYPAPGHAPAFEKGWYYSNTAYILSQMIAQRASGIAFDDLVRDQLIAREHLTNSFFEINMYPPTVRSRMVDGYFASHDAINAGLQPLYGKSVRDLSVSWLQGAGGIVGTPDEVTHWVRALFDGPLLARQQRADMERIVSLASGKPVASTSAKDPRGFGLGIAQMTMPGMGTYWFYEGETLGYRVMYVYLPLTRTVYAVGTNSQPDGKQDKLGPLMGTIYKTLQTHNAL